jgi:hypothetical protein
MRKAAVFALVGALVLGGGVLGAIVLRADTTHIPGSETPTDGTSARSIPPLRGGMLEPGRYAFTSFDERLDASYRITIQVPAGYTGFEGWAALMSGTSQTAVSTMAIGGIYADPCHSKGSLLDGPAISSVGEVVAALASQKGFRVSTPTDVTLDGYSGTYVERRVPARTDLTECDGNLFRVYHDVDRGPTGGLRYLVPGELQQLWVLDVDGVPLVIDASLNPGMSAEIRAELRRMVDSVRIEPRSDG